jgi:nitroreductase
LPPDGKWVERFIWQDTSCAMQNMMLVAESLGLKTCWASITPKQQKNLEKYFMIPKHLALTCMLFVGYSNAKPHLGNIHQGKTIRRNFRTQII